MKMRGIIAGLAGLLFATQAMAQAQLGAGQVWGNNTAARAPGQSATVTSILDRALGSTRGAIIERGAAGWVIIGPSATVGLPFVSAGAAADPLYQLLGVNGGGTGINVGVSGGIPYFSSTSLMASSAALGASRIVFGGGAGVAPATGLALGTTTQVLHGNAAGLPTWAAVSLTADVSGQLPLANGGCNGTTAATCLNNIMPTPVRAGDIVYWNGTAWTQLSGNNSGTSYLSENSSGVPSWQPVVTPVVAVKIQTFCPAGCTTSIAGGADGTYTPSTGMLYAIVEPCGGGGGGGGTANTAAAVGAGAAGGASSGYTKKILTAAAIGASKTVRIGVAGAAGASGNNAGGAGGATCLGGSACSSILASSNGGGGGGGSAGSGAPTPSAGGAPGTGDIAALGVPGGAFPAIPNSQGYGGFGGNHPTLGGGAPPVMTATTANGSAGGSCSGGSGGASFNAGGAASGGAGGPGYLQITEFTSQ